MTSWVCPDSSLVLNLYLPQPLRPNALALWQAWLSNEVQLAAPVLFCYEAAAICRKNVVHGVISVGRGREILDEVLSLSVAFISPPNLHARAYELATQLGQSTSYDAHYLVVAQELGCEFWTADRRLVNAAGETFPWVRWLGDYSPTTA